MESPKLKAGYLYKATLIAFCLLSVLYCWQLTVSLTKLPTPYFWEILPNASFIVRSNPIPSFVILTTIAIWLRSGMAIWIHIAMMLSALASQWFILYRSSSPATLFEIAMEFLGLWLIYRLWRNGELVMMHRPRSPGAL